ncbi:hypothetical protein BU16DRAFT_319275 [Lophium mytilinum]|uniref:BTB domain-containing protein n=1 Tax=Lophium mytilinum TaxID=390894 RepID=A0A6A6QYS9_9PEZI|nr:hypothetical protein BU16DRAFT_319275 [Lophium mytilinum]
MDSSSDDDYHESPAKRLHADDTPPKPSTPEPITPEPVTLANPSDLTLIVGPLGQSIHVSRGALRLASPVWNTMFSDQWAESSKKEVQFPDDDPEALLIVLGIAHLRFKERPKVLLYRQLVELAVICDKYDTVAVIRPFLQEWIGYEEMKVGPGTEEWIFVAWTFGIRDKFVNGVQDLVRNTLADAQECLVWPEQHVTLRLPIDLLDCISQARQESITKLMNLAFGHLDTCVSINKCARGSQTCIGNTMDEPDYHPPFCYVSPPILLHITPPRFSLAPARNNFV